MNIIFSILDTPGIHINTYLPLCLPGILPKLVYDKVQIRHKAVYILRKLVRILKKNTLLHNFLLFLDIEDEEWHRKEELLLLICYIFL